MKYIETLREGERIAGIYLCKFCQQALTKNGKAYLNVILHGLAPAPLMPRCGIPIPRALMILRRWITLTSWAM